MESATDNVGPEGSQRFKKPPSKRRMIVLLTALLALVGLLVYLLRTGVVRLPGGSAEIAASHHEEYYCPMHPEQRSDRPGNCPICSMQLVKLEQPGQTVAPAGPATVPAADSMPGMQHESADHPVSTSGPSIFIAPERQQLIGVRTVAAEIKPLSLQIRTVGKIAYDETKITHIHTKVSGFIEEVFVDFVGRPVKQGEPLFTIYSPDLVATQEEYLLALKSRDALADSQFEWISGGASNLLDAARKRLLLWDISEEEIQTLETEGKVKRALTIYSPVSGIVTERAAYHHGRHVTPEMDLYTIVDLSTVWILGQVYEYELPHVKVGQMAEVEFPYSSGIAARRGRVAFISPMLNPSTRTAEVRLEFPNPDLSLKPDMFVNFKLNVDLGRRLVVPQDAVLQTGTEQYVFVDLSQGYFEPRPVKLGPQAGDSYAIESGLKSGEKVVTAANFILDSESRLKGAFAAMGKPSSVQAGPPAAAAQNLQVEVLEPKTAKVGRNAIRLAVKDASGKAIEGAQVQVELLMPQMGSMPPMSSKANLQHSGNGVYFGTIEVPMAWTWETTVRVNQGGQPVGTAKTTITAR